MSDEAITLVVLAGGPVVAVLCLGLLMRDLTNDGRGRAALWLIVLVVCIVVWYRFLTAVP